ncbi:NADP-dependent phosphogluconate dehydrogenase [Sporocytophaga myxococcoides]|uniref:NADP-dependent phosphogluconate dehydrogenase n=1 Tax=Sporocytophaga myxococcoides TaxID=153721 RepID=UPI0004077A34|nr:NADP-dependent phosphogluconate dehydrogenase [Sporocytophaga myxococcoides]
MNSLAQFGVVGLGVMGKSLALNLAEKGINVSVYNRHITGSEENIAVDFVKEQSAKTVMSGFDDLRAFVISLEKPRKILLMIQAGSAVDQQLDQLLPVLDRGDILIDGGNSFYKDTNKRTKQLNELGIHFIGAGISGGEEGARKGPSIMPGGDKDAYNKISSYLELIAAKDKQGKPCITYIGEEGAGHFVKMVHNGIEYAEMQILTEVYFLLRYYSLYPAEKIADLFTQWQHDGLDGYLLEITIDILRKKEDGVLLLDKILDKAAQKGTGGWSTTAAMDLGVPFSTVSEAVMARALSSFKSYRQQISSTYSSPLAITDNLKDSLSDKIKNAYKAARIINHETGFHLLKEASVQYRWNLNLSEIARIWTNGCIIRSELMEQIATTFLNEESIVLAPSFKKELIDAQRDFTQVITTGLSNDIALPVLSSALNYYLGLKTLNSGANLIQAQRDYFGAHTYQRIDTPDKYFHTHWKN